MTHLHSIAQQSGRVTAANLGNSFKMGDQRTCYNSRGFTAFLGRSSPGCLRGEPQIQWKNPFLFYDCGTQGELYNLCRACFGLWEFNRSTCVEQIYVKDVPEASFTGCSKVWDRDPLLRFALPSVGQTCFRGVLNSSSAPLSHRFCPELLCP